jgi:hypothetical protein
MQAEQLQSAMAFFRLDHKRSSIAPSAGSRKPMAKAKTPPRRHAIPNGAANGKYVNLSMTEEPDAAQFVKF